jgi:hypothetical protein
MDSCNSPRDDDDDDVDRTDGNVSSTETIYEYGAS